MNIFNYELDSTVLTTSYIISDRLPILLVFHDNDDSGIAWQFHAGSGDYSEDKLKLVSLGQILAIDPTISQLGNLPLGYKAVRKSINDRWEYLPQ